MRAAGAYAIGSALVAEVLMVAIWRRGTAALIQISNLGATAAFVLWFVRPIIWVADYLEVSDSLPLRTAVVFEELL